MKIWFLVIMIILGSCKPQVSDIAGLIGKKISLHPSLKLQLNGKDSIVSDFLNVQSKLIILYDTTGCSTCKIKRIEDWNYMIELAESLAFRFRPIFVVEPTPADTVQVQSLLSDFNYPIYYDSNGNFRKANPFIFEGHSYDVFLVNHKNEIVLIGNPNGNIKLRELYIETIRKICAK